MNRSYPQPGTHGIGHLVRAVTTVDPDTRVRLVQATLQEKSPLDCVVVARERCPLGLVMRCHLDRSLSTEFGRALYLNRPISDIMDRDPVVLDAETNLEEASRRAMARDDTHLYDDLIVSQGGKLLGTVSVQVLLTRVAEAHGVLQIAGGIAHELNQPLQVVLGYGELLAARVGESGYDHAVGNILDGVRRITEITRRLQALTTGYRTAPYLEGCRVVDLSSSPASPPPSDGIGDGGSR